MEKVNLAEKFAQITEYWPEPFIPPKNRSHLTEPMA